MRRIARIIVLGLLAAGLICYLVSRAGLTWSAFIHSMAGFSDRALFCIVVLMAINLGCAAFKWLLVSRVLASNAGRSVGRFTDAWLATTFGALLGTIMPFQLGVALARWLAARIGAGPSAGLSVGATLYEQLFDAIILLAAAAVSIVGLVLHCGLMGWAVLILSAILGVTIPVPLWFSPILALVARCVSWIPFGNVPNSVSEIRAGVAKAAGFSPSTIRYLAVLSLLRYATTVALIAIVLDALQMWDFAIPVIIGLPLVTLIGLVPITPGSLGVTEWTWSAILLSAGATMGAAGLFALTNRIINIVALLTLIVLQFAILMLRRLPTVQWGRAG